MKAELKNEKALRTFVDREVIPKLIPKKSRGFLLLLQGELGVGKTTLTKHLAHVFGASRSVVSPTFILERDYILAPRALFKTLVHIDAYRFETPQEGAILEVEKRLEDANVLIVVEWPEKMGDTLPSPDMKINITHGGGDVRTITLTTHEN